MSHIKLETLKYISAGIIWFTTLIGSAMPMCICEIKWQSRLEALAGGVFLGAGLAHFLSDSFVDIGSFHNYPLASAIAVSTFVLLTAVELFSYGEHDKEFDTSESKEEAKEMIRTDNPLEANNEIPNEEQIQGMFSTSNMGLMITTISLYIIMDVHSVIEGLALGIMKTFNGIIAIFFAIVGHKPVEAFALSLIILKDKPTKTLFWIFVVLYTLMSPVGVIVGIIITKHVQNRIVMGTIAAFSAGTFLFVGCNEWSEMFSHKTEWNISEKGWHFSIFFIGVL